MTLLARLIAQREGFGIPGTLPTRNHNPGDLRHSPHSQHDPGNPDGIGIIDSDADGWADEERQLRLYCVEHPDITIKDMIEQYYAPPNENDSAAYVAFVLDKGGWTEATTVAEALECP
jgi:hypothetical protein